MVKNNAVAPVNAPVSAFAKRKTVERDVSETPAKRNSQTNKVSSIKRTVTKEPRPLKRRKAVKLPKPRLLPNTDTASYSKSDTRSVDTEIKYRDASSSGESESSSQEEFSSAELLEASHPIVKNSNESEHSSSGSECFTNQGIPDRQLSTFVPSGTNIVENTPTGWTVRLRELDSLVLIGQFDVWVQKGAISVFGATLHASSKLHRFYAPSTHSLPIIRQKRDPCGPEHQSTEITISSCFTRIRLLRRLSSRFRRVWSHKKTSVAGNIALSSLKFRSFSYLSSLADDPHRRPLSVVQPSQDWDAILSRLLTLENVVPKIILVCGPKGSGKSTFCRLLINSFLSRKFATMQVRSAPPQPSEIALLDLDPGQPEFMPPGEISLVHLRSFILGPPFTHPMMSSGSGDRVVKAHHIGAPSPKDDPDHYVRCVSDLLQHYQSILASGVACPLVINCSGWVQGSGLEVLQTLVEMTKPTDVTYLSRKGPEDVIEALSETTSKSGASLHLLSSQPQKYVNRTAADLRIMQALSYFHVENSERGQLQWNPSIISRMEPLTVSYGGPSRTIFGVLILGEALDPEYLIVVLDGSLVGIVVAENNSAFPEPHERSSDPNSHEGPKEKIINGEDDDVRSLDSSDVDDFAGSEQGTCQSSEDPPSSLTNTDTAHRGRARQRLATGHWLISRTQNEEIPYMHARSGICQPPNPLHSRSIGQAYVRSIDMLKKVFHLVTPISQAQLDLHRQKNEKIMLIRGKLDTPTWAYQEECAASQSTIKGRNMGSQEDEDVSERDFNIRAWVNGASWVKAVDDRKAKHQRDKVWKVRRNLKSKDFDSEPGQAIEGTDC